MFMKYLVTISTTRSIDYEVIAEDRWKARDRAVEINEAEGSPEGEVVDFDKYAEEIEGSEIRDPNYIPGQETFL